jgi:hypothetical protein
MSNQTDIKALLETVSPEEGVKLKVLHNAVVQGMRAYKEKPGAGSLRDWRAAEEALKEEVERIEAREMESAPAGWGEFKDTANRAEVLRFLRRMGYQVAQRTFYRHCDAGLCKRGTKGTWSRRTVKAYAENHLHLGDAAVTEVESEPGLLQARLKEQVERERINKQRDEIRLRRESGAVIDRDSLNLEVAARAVALDSGVRQMVNAKGYGWIVAVCGDTDKIAELTALILRDWDELINTYATAGEFEVVFEDQETGDR